MTDTIRDLARAKATFQARALRAILTTKGKTMKDEAPELLPCPFCGSAAATNIPPLRNRVECAGDCSATADNAAAWNTRAPSPAPEITEEMVERAIEAALPELQRREAVMADPMTLDLLQTRRIVRAALTAALAPDPSRSPADDNST